MTDDTFTLSKEGIAQVEQFRKKHPKLYMLITAYVTMNFFEMLKEELDEKDYERIMKSMAFNT